jgi:hypothetical protein
LDGLSFDSIGVEEALNNDKVLGPDGFTKAFFQTFWDVLEVDIKMYSMIFFFFYRYSMIFMLKVCLKKCFNATFITLIPKKPEVVDIKNFQPISLAGEVYKIVVKVLVIRLKW